MEMIKRKIRLFLVSYGRLFGFTIGIIFIIIFTIQSLNKMVIKQNNEKYSSEQYQNEQLEKNKQKEEEEYISQFINYCNEGKIEEAYKMLSNTCKQEKYSTIEKFKEEYVDKVFIIKICEHKILKQNNIYIITLTQDILITGKTNSNVEQRYRIIEGVLQKEIYICD